MCRFKRAKKFKGDLCVAMQEFFNDITICPCPSEHKKFIHKFQLPFTLGADTELKMLKDYGVWGLKKFMGKEYTGVLRTTFIIDEKSIIVHIIDKVKTRDHAEQILELLQGS